MYLAGNLAIPGVECWSEIVNLDYTFCVYSKIASVITPGTREEIQEEYDFIDACMETKVFETAKNFMVEKGKHYQVSLWPESISMIKNDLVSQLKYLM